MTMLTAEGLRDFIATHPAAIVAELTAVRGSSPRNAGTFMLIAPDAITGTIGGGALEYIVIDRARQVLRDGIDSDTLDIPLGPEIGQCCGGRVDIALNVLDPLRGAVLVDRVQRETDALPNVFLFGSGHVGQALARSLSLLPLKVHAVDTRPDELAGLPEAVEAIASPMPEAVVRSAPIGSAYVILTHDHALDFMIAFEALKRADSPYVGMVGSKTKRAKFQSWYLSEGGDARQLARLVLPIGGAAFPHGLGDKRPEVIAALAAAEIMVQIAAREVSVGADQGLQRVSGAIGGR